MPTLLRHTQGAALSLLLLAALPASADGKRPITETDLFRFTWIADPQIAPDGSRIAFVRVAINRKKDGYDAALWMVPADGSEAPRPFTAGPQDVSPRWSPDGRRLAFTRAVERDGKLQPAQLCVISANGGEACCLTDLPKGVGGLAWSPDGRTIALTSTTNAKDLEKQEQERRKDRGTSKDARDAAEERESDVRVITRAVYRSNARGYLDPTRPSHIWTVDAVAAGADAPPPRQITSGEFEESGPVFSPDGSSIYFTSTREREPYYTPPDADLYAVGAGGGEIRKVASIDGVIGDFAISPDGKRIAFRGVPNGRPTRSYNQPDLFVTEDGSDATARNLTASFDYDVGAGLTGDQRAPRGGQPSRPLWSADGKALLMVAAEHGRANLRRIDAVSGRVEPVTNGDHEVVGYTSTADGSRLALLVSTPTNIADLFLVDGAGGEMKRLTRVNEDLFSEIALPEPEEIWYPSFDGRKIHAWVQKPPDFDASKKYPLILNIHGGPHAAYGYTFFHEFQWMAAKGYVVLYPNPRGSSAYGQQFGNVIQYAYPGDDYRDLMAGVDELLKRGYADPKRLGVTGGSGGGVLTNWTITRTDRFAAAVSQRSIADWAGFWYTADFTLFNPSWFRKAPWQDPADFAARSPITHAGRITTPLMLIEGEADHRTPPSDGGEQMFRALKYLRRPVVMVRFPEESHELSRSGKPWHRVERLQHILAWFDKYLQGKQIDAYDTP